MPEKEIGIRKEYDPTDQEREALTLVYRDRYPAMRDNEKRKEAERRWDKAEQAWENYRKEKEADDWQSNHIVPLTFSVVETALSEMIDQIHMPTIGARGEEDVPRARVMDHTYKYTWECADSDITTYDVLKDTLVLGTGIWQEYYWKDRRMIQNVTGIDEKTKKEKIVETEVFDYDDVYGEVVKLQDFFVDDMARSFRGPYRARDAIRRYIMTEDDVKTMFQGPVWDPMGNAKYVKPGGDINYYEYYTPPEGMDPNKLVEVLWYWSERPKDKLVIVANDVVLRMGPNSYRHKKLPFARSIDVKRVHSFWGKGEAEILESEQDESNVLRRMIIDRNHLDIDKMFIVGDRIGLNDEDLIARPHGMIPGDENVKPVEYGDIPRSVELSLKHLEDDATIATGINPRAQSLPTAGSATEAAILKESTLKRIRLKIWLQKKELLRDVARLRVANIIQFYSQPKLEKIVGERGTQAFELETQKLSDLGLLHQGDDGEMYKKEYRQIELEGTQLDFDPAGKLTEQSTRGTTFFTLKPEFFVPVSRGGYTFTFGSTPMLEISKPLMQSKMLELYDRLITNPAFDPGKLGDEVIKAHEMDPNKFKPDEVIQSESDQRLQMMVELAGIENKMLLQGKEVPPTANASPAHTRIHVEFMNSDQFQDQSVGPDIAQRFSDHVVGELGAQGMREQMGGMGSEMPQGRQMGTQPGGQSVNGKMNRPGGIQKPTRKMEEILPAFNTGGNRRSL